MRRCVVTRRTANKKKRKKYILSFSSRKEKKCLLFLFTLSKGTETVLEGSHESCARSALPHRSECKLRVTRESRLLGAFRWPVLRSQLAHISKKEGSIYTERKRERNLYIHTKAFDYFCGDHVTFSIFPPPLSYVIVWALFYWASTARQKSERKSQLPVKEEEEKKFHDATACVLFIKLFAHKGNIRQNAKCGVIKQTETMKSITTLRVRLIRQFVSLSLARAIGFEFNWFLRLSSSIRTRRCQKVYRSLRIPRVAISRLALWTSTG